MKIAIIVTSLEKKGPVIVAATIAQELKRLGYCVDILYFYERTNSIDINSLTGIEIKKINFKTFFHLKEYQVIHSHSLIPDVYSALQSFLYNNKTVSTVHNNVHTDLVNEYGKIKSSIMKLIWQIAWLKIDTKVCLSKTMLNYYNLSRFKGGKWTYIYNPVNTNSQLVVTNEDSYNLNIIKMHKSKGKKIIGTCAVITERKGLQYVLRVAKNLASEYDIFIIGEGPYKQNLEKYISDHELNNVFLIKASKAAKLYMELFDIYIMPSITEGFGLAAAEGAIAGCRLLCSDIATFRELFEDKCGYFNLDDDTSLLNAIYSIEQQSRERLLKLVVNKFDAHAVTMKYLETYKYDERFSRSF
ncbi:glycosyltransferase family 4 protein [Enterobacteriaceae bacterium]